MLSVDEIWMVIAAHAFLYGTALWVTRRPVITMFHLFLFTSTLAFVLRPLLATWAGGHSLYPVGDTRNLYKLGLIYQWIFNLCLIVAYLLIWRRPRVTVTPLLANSVIKGWWLSFFAGLISVGVIHILSAGTWLPSARSATITSVVPFGKVLFPLAVIPLSIGLPLAYLVLIKKRRLWFIAVSLVLFKILLLSLLYQRGFVITGLVIAVFFMDKLGRFNYRKAVIAAALAMAALFILRPLGLVLSGSSLVEALGGNLLNRIRYFIFGPNFDTPDVWPIAIEYTEVNGLAAGSTFLAIPARFASPGFRYRVGFFTAVDRLNEFYWEQRYWLTNFGFNVNLAQEAYINFGIVGLAFGLVPGLVTAWLDRWLWGLKRLDTLKVYLVGAAFISGGLAGEIGGALQWATAYASLGTVLWLVSRLRWRPKFGESHVLGSSPALHSSRFN